jgi:hypothetical protein
MRKPIVNITFGREIPALEIENYHSSASKYLEKDYYVLSTQSIENKQTTIELMGDSNKRLSEMEEDDFFNAEKAREEEQLRLVYQLKKLLEEESKPQTTGFGYLFESPVKKEDSYQHYNNDKGSIYKFAVDKELNSYEFDIIKRIARCRKKGQFIEDIDKTIFLLELYKKEYADTAEIKEV